MHTQGLRDHFLSAPPATRSRSTEIRQLIVTADAPQPRGTHAGLWLDKYILSQEKKEDIQEPGGQVAGPQHGSEPTEKENSRTRLIREVSELPIPPIYEQYYQRWKQTLHKYNARWREAQTKGRMIVGLGAESVLETSVALHHTYGVPYIPGSALKGLAASYLRSQFGEGWRKDETKLRQYKTIFGDTNEAGFIIFFDALYIPPQKEDKQRVLHQDIITVHHPDYYSGKKDVSSKDIAPKDWDSPNPVPFLSATGSYLVALAAPDLQKPDLWIKATFDILDNALQNWGIGAKTSNGYGRMELKPDPEVKKAEGYIREIEALKDVAGQIPSYFQKWQQLASSEARILLGKAIIDKVRKAGREKVTAEKPWYKEIVTFLAKQ